MLYKDIIEPLETMSVTIIPTDKESITELGARFWILGSI